jgi:glycosyltransferase involved in cell wall biosynthesis
MNNPRRIMFLTTIPQTLTAFFPRQLRLLAEAGFAVHAVSSPGEELEWLGRECGIATHGVPMERQPHPVRDVLSLGRLFRLMRRVRPDVVHAHTPKAGLLGMAAARAAGVPVRLYTVHGLPLVTRTGLWRRVLETAEWTSAALSTRTYCVSHSVRREVVNLRLCSAQKAFTLGAGSCAGVDIGRFQPRNAPGAARQKLGIPQSAILATFIGRLARDKGITVLAEAWPLVKSRCPDMRLLLAGKEDSTDPVAPAALSRLRNDPSVHWAGSVPKADVPSIYAATDICVLPTFREGLSQVALEAGAMGVPIVSSDVLGLDAVLNGVTGLLVAPGEPGLLAEAILKLAGSPSRLQMGRAAIERIRAEYSDQRVNNLWMTEYQHLIAGLGPAAAASPRDMTLRNS